MRAATGTTSNGKKQKPYRGMAMEGTIARWYNKSTRNRGDFVPAANRIANALPNGGDVLEIAPGPGFLAIELAKFKDFHVTGLDISATFVEIARANAKEAGVQIEFRQGDVAAMQFGDERFDFITCHAAFKNFSRPVAALQEMYRVLRPGGKVSIVDMRPDALPEAINAEVKKMKLSLLSSIFTRLTFKCVLLKTAHSKEELREYVSRSGFGHCIIEETPLGFELKVEKASH
jgi:ubiquinone/menaquinone biosynthesis C-methylase UbiE